MTLMVIPARTPVIPVQAGIQRRGIGEGVQALLVNGNDGMDSRPRIGVRGRPRGNDGCLRGNDVHRTRGNDVHRTRGYNVHETRGYDVLRARYGFIRGGVSRGAACGAGLRRLRLRMRRRCLGA